MELGSENLIRLGIMWSRYNMPPCILWIHSKIKRFSVIYLHFKGVTRIQGLVFSRSFVKSSVVSVLITYLTQAWKNPHFQIAAAIANVQEGVSHIMVIFLADISDTQTRRFRTIFSTNVAYIIGLLLLWFSALNVGIKSEDGSDWIYYEESAAWIFYGAAVLLAIGEAGMSSTLSHFLNDQYSSELQHTSIDEKQMQTHGEKDLWIVPWCLGLATAFVFPYSSPLTDPIISAFFMGVSCLLFEFGFFYYFPNNRNPADVEEGRRTGKLCLDSSKEVSAPCTAEQQEERGSDSSEVEVIPLLVVDEPQRGENIGTTDSTEMILCIVEVELSAQVGELCEEVAQVSIPPTVQQGGGGTVITFWTLKKLKEQKSFFKDMLVMWPAFLVYSMVGAAGSTFFLEQIDNWNKDNDTVGQEFISLQILRMFFSSFFVSYMCNKLFPKMKGHAVLVRIGCGMACSVLCCAVAWKVEVHRLYEIKKMDHTTKTTLIPMSKYWLIPQFFLLGVMEGLAEEGLNDFFAHRVADGDKVMATYYGSHTTDFVLGIGKLLTSISIVAFGHSWFNNRLNKSCLDKYYRALTFLSFGNLIYYLCISLYFYAKDESQDSYNEETKQSKPDAMFVMRSVGGADFDIEQKRDDEIPCVCKISRWCGL